MKQATTKEMNPMTRFGNTTPSKGRAIRQAMNTINPTNAAKKIDQNVSFDVLEMAVNVTDFPVASFVLTKLIAKPEVKPR